MLGLCLREERKRQKGNKTHTHSLKFLFFHVMRKQRLRKKKLGERTEFLLGSIEPLMPAEAGVEIRKVAVKY